MLPASLNQAKLNLLTFNFANSGGNSIDFNLIKCVTLSCGYYSDS